MLQHLNEHRPKVVHFSGHGSPLGKIVLEDDVRGSMPVGVRALQHVFQSAAESTQLVVLNACFSQPQARAVTRSVDCAIGSTREISDRDAVAFAGAFYSAIGFGHSVKTAFDQAVAGLLLGHPDLPQTALPRLVVKKGVEPSALRLKGDLAGAAAVQAQEGRGADLASGVLTCVLADDHPAILEGVSETLEGAGIKLVAQARDGERALAAIETHRPDVALLDVRMPRLDGIEVARHIFRSPLDTAVILYTSYADRELLADALNYGVRGYVLKEAPLPELVRAIETVAAGGSYVDGTLSAVLRSQ